MPTTTDFYKWLFEEMLLPDTHHEYLDLYNAAHGPQALDDSLTGYWSVATANGTLLVHREDAEMTLALVSDKARKAFRLHVGRTLAGCPPEWCDKDGEPDMEHWHSYEDCIERHQDD